MQTCKYFIDNHVLSQKYLFSRRLLYLVHTPDHEAMNNGKLTSFFSNCKTVVLNLSIAVILSYSSLCCADPQP